MERHTATEHGGTRMARRNRAPVALLVLCLACSCFKTAPTETSIEHARVPREHSFEALSISSAEVRYAEDLSLKQRALSLKYQPGEKIAARVREWCEATGLWGGPQSLSLEIGALRLKERSLHAKSYGTDWESDEGVEDRIGVIAEVRENGEVVHRIDLEREKGFLGDTTLAIILSNDAAMDDLIADIAWRIVYEMTPPGYDEEIIRLGWKEQVYSATVLANRRGLLTWSERFGERVIIGDHPIDTICGTALSVGRKWNNATTYDECAKRARQSANRSGEVDDCGVLLTLSGMERFLWYYQMQVVGKQYQRKAAKYDACKER